MNKATKMTLGVVTAVAIVGGGVYAVGTSGSNDTKSVSKESSVKSSSKVSSEKPKGTIKVADLKTEPSLSGAVIAQYAAEAVQNDSWQVVKQTLASEKALNLWVKLDDAGAEYHYVDADNSPYYRLAQDGDVVVYYDANNKKLDEIKLTDLVNTVNKTHTNAELDTVKNRVSVQMVDDKKSAGFDAVAGEYLWAAGTGSGGTFGLTVSPDGGFKGYSDGYVQTERFKSEFQGTLGELVKVNDLEYETTIKSLTYRPKETVKTDTWTLQYDKPSGIEQGDKITIYLKGSHVDKAVLQETRVFMSMGGGDWQGKGPVGSNMLLIHNKEFARGFWQQ